MDGFQGSAAPDGEMWEPRDIFCVFCTETSSLNMQFLAVPGTSIGHLGLRPTAQIWA